MLAGGGEGLDLRTPPPHPRLCMTFYLPPCSRSAEPKHSLASWLWVTPDTGRTPISLDTLATCMGQRSALADARCDGLKGFSQLLSSMRTPALLAWTLQAREGFCYGVAAPVPPCRM
jgi:hypothetical protein